VASVLEVNQMKLTLNRIVNEWSGWPKALHDSLDVEKAPEQRAGSVARLLRKMVPAAAVAGCELQGQQATALAVAMQEDSTDPRLGEQVRGWVQRLERPIEGFARSAFNETEPALTCIACSTSSGSFQGGILALGFGGVPSKSVVKAAETFLSLAANSLAAHLRIESISGQPTPAQSLPDLATLRSHLHAVNNCLNGMMLQASVIQMKVDSHLRDEVEQIRREGMEAAARMAQIQRLNLW